MGVSTDSDGDEDNWNSQSEPSTSPCSDVPENDGKFIYVLVDLFFFLFVFEAERIKLNRFW